MKKIPTTFVSFLICATSFAQIKIGDNPATINANSIIELESSTKGALISRVSLSSTTNKSPLSAHVAGMIIYNTATTGDVTPGFYYNDGSKWLRVADRSEKKYSPNNCSCKGAFPYTVPADLTTFYMADANWSGNGSGNTTLADIILPTIANARAAGHRIGDVITIYRSSGYNMVIGKDNTNLSANLLVTNHSSIGFSMSNDKWYRIF